jgi:hypothetical protein
MARFSFPSLSRHDRPNRLLKNAHLLRFPHPSPFNVKTWEKKDGQAVVAIKKVYGAKEFESLLDGDLK